MKSESQLADVIEELKRREPIFHRPEFGEPRADVERMLADEFRECGASGRMYTREFVLDVIGERGVVPPGDDWRVSDVRCQEIAADNYLFTYTLAQGPRVTRRATIWRRTSDGWKIVFHQGTLVEGSRSS